MNFSFGENNNRTLINVDFTQHALSSINQWNNTTTTTTTEPTHTLSSTNATHNTPAPTIPPIVMTTIFVFNGILALIGIAGNAVVCLVIVHGRKMYTIANLFLMNLAIADMCVLVVSYPLWILQTLAPSSWPFGGALCKIIPSVSDAFYGVSLGCMTAISIHRYRMILHAVGRQLTFTNAKLIILIIWVISLASISVPLFPVKRYHSSDKGGGGVSSCYSKWPSRSYERSYQLFLFIFWYVFPLLIILFTFVRIKLYLEKQMKYEWLKGSEHTMLVANHITGIRKALRMLAPVVIVFAILMLPWNIIRLVSYFTEYHLIDDIQIYIVISGTMLIANSVSNPFIYYIKSREFRLEFQKQYWLIKVKLGIQKLNDEEGRFVIEPNQHSGRIVVRRAQSFLIENAAHNHQHHHNRSHSETITSDFSPTLSINNSTRSMNEMNDRFMRLFNNNNNINNTSENNEAAGKESNFKNSASEMNDRFARHLNSIKNEDGGSTVNADSPNHGQLSPPPLVTNNNIISPTTTELYMIEEEENSHHDLDYPHSAAKLLVKSHGMGEKNFDEIVIGNLKETDL